MNINFAKNQGFVQAVVQDTRTDKILRVGYINKIALDQMESTKQVVLWNDNKEETQIITGGEYNVQSASASAICVPSPQSISIALPLYSIKKQVNHLC